MGFVRLRLSSPPAGARSPRPAVTTSTARLPSRARKRTSTGVTASTRSRFFSSTTIARPPAARKRSMLAAVVERLDVAVDRSRRVPPAIWTSPTSPIELPSGVSAAAASAIGRGDLSGSSAGYATVKTTSRSAHTATTGIASRKRKRARARHSASCATSAAATIAATAAPVDQRRRLRLAAGPQRDPDAAADQRRAEHAGRRVERDRDAVRRLDPAPESVREQQRDGRQQRHQVEPALAGREREEDQRRARSMPAGSATRGGSSSFAFATNTQRRAAHHTTGASRNQGRRLGRELVEVVVERPRVRAAREEAPEQIRRPRRRRRSRAARARSPPRSRRAPVRTRAGIPTTGTRGAARRRRRSQPRKHAITSTGTRMPTGPLVRTASPSDACSTSCASQRRPMPRSRCQKATSASVSKSASTTSSCARRALSANSKVVSSNARAERGGRAPEQPRAEREREADQRDAGERRGQPRRHFRHAADGRARCRRQPVVERRLLRVGLAVQVQQHEPARAELHRADRLGDVAVARFVGCPEARAVETREQQAAPRRRAAERGSRDSRARRSARLLLPNSPRRSRRITRTIRRCVGRRGLPPRDRRRYLRARGGAPWLATLFPIRVTPS